MTHIYTHQIAHKIAVVIGSSRQNKYSGIVTNARKIGEAQTVSDEINRMDCESVALGADVSKESDCVTLIEETIKHFS